MRLRKKWKEKFQTRHLSCDPFKTQSQTPYKITKKKFFCHNITLVDTHLQNVNSKRQELRLEQGMINIG